MASFLFLGTGASMGTPVIGCKCAICQNADGKQTRLRSSGLLKIQGKQILIDAGPDCRKQALTYGIEEIDALLLTHAHYDHIGGIEDLRILYYLRGSRPIPCYLSTFSQKVLEKKDYISSYFCMHVFSGKMGDLSVEGLPFFYFHYFQKELEVTGYRIGSFAYVTDISHYYPDIFSCLEGVNTLVIGACKWESSPAHLGLKEIVDFAKVVGAKRTLFTHVSHEIDEKKAASFLSSGMEFAFDGLEIPLEC